MDDGSWSEISPRLDHGQMPDDWTGEGWFRLRFETAPELRGVPLAWRSYQAGASEIYVDGELIARLGRFHDGGGFQGETSPHSAVWTVDEPGEHVLAVRFANPRVADYQRVGWFGGFRMTVGRADRALRQDVDDVNFRATYLGLFCGTFLSFALLHILLFAFYPSVRENLYFALLCVDAALLVYLLIYKGLISDPVFLLWSEPLMNVTGVLFGVLCLRFVYGVFYERLPRFFRGLLAVAATLCLWTWLRPAETLQWVFLFMLASSLEMIRVVAVALARRKPGSRLIGAGAVALAAGFSVGLLANLGVIPGSWLIGFLIPFSSLVALVVSMSVHLSYSFATTHRELRRKLVEVEELSEQKLAQERRARQKEVERKLLEAEYARQVEELEEARQLQLSMLPKRIPQLPELEIVAHMDTATEVGGDYYDFDLSDDGTLTIAVGDATGHGMRAGTMVTATKSLFNALAPESDLLATLGRSSSALKRMNLRKLAMALILAHYKDGELRIAAAGMPPAYVYRHASGVVDAVELAGMPLGTLPGFPYRDSVIRLEPGDTVLLMSDGLPERLDPQGEMLGYERTVEAFLRIASRPADTILEHLVREGAAWADGRPADDDTTLVILKARVPSSS